MKRVALVIATNAKGQILLGKRNDTGKWTLPGGHLNEGEDPEVGAARELKEETNLTPDDDFMEKVDERTLGQAMFYTYACSVSGKPTGKNDPDEECSEWCWFDIDKGIPKELQGKLAGPRDESKNIIVDHFGLEKADIKNYDLNYEIPGEFDAHAHFANGNVQHENAHIDSVIPTQSSFHDGRMEGIKQAMGRGENLPPIQILVDSRGKRMLWDGHHRIAAARSLGMTHYPAHVVSVSGLKKAEDDEVMRMLVHPNRDERRMALKLGTVNDRHLMRALTDEDPSIQHDALNHPAMSHGSLMSLMRQPQSEALQLLGMNHKLFDREHLRALYDMHANKKTSPVMNAITLNPHLYPELMEKIYQDGNGSRQLMSRTDAPPSIINRAIEAHLNGGPERRLALEAIKSPHADHKLVEKAIREGDEGIQLAAASSPGLAPNVAEDVLRRSHTALGKESFLRSALMRSPFATERHLDLGLEDPHPLVRAAVFQTQSPLLKAKHVDRAIEKGHAHDILMALKSKAANPGHLSKLAQHKDPKIKALYAAYTNKAVMKKYESELGTFLKKNNLHDIDPNSEIVRDMLGYNHSLMSTFDAAKFLIAGVQPSLEQVRKAIWQADGDVEQAALIAYGLEVNESNLRALRAVRDLRENKKAEQLIEAHSITPGTEEASKAAEAVQRAFQDRFVFPVKLGGKHSEGTLLARDSKGGEVYLLKPGSGPISPAAGDDEESASQSRREAGYWHIADSWGIGNYFPHTDLIIIDGKEFACIELLPWHYKTLDKLKKDDPTFVTKLLHPYLKSGALHKWAIIDFVLGNPDRHANNLMADSTGDTPHADVKLIDHGSAMAGEDFDPANDQSSFVPYYLRAWVIGPFNNLSVTDKLKVMPRVDDHIAEELHDWVSNIHSQDLQARLMRYGINPAPAMERLAKLKAMMSEFPVDLAINKLWVTT